MNNLNKNLKTDFKIVTNMKLYFQNNIEQLIQPSEDEPQLEITSNSNYVLLPDLKSMVFNLVDLERNDFDQQSINQSMYMLSSTNASCNKISVIFQSLSNESISSNSIGEEF
ncbi:unnamed protein product [Paramecium primaurelia]|uniref:Uncharacterized protein n=1 Tax=Paramecium primaurelia TaxID=5886 RepID=A0A8S1MDJ5_PARPR|nr:unnamed protein product [Paramecium primaurelia]